MRVEEFFINRYGPLAFPKPVVPGRCTFFLGDNEDGKSLTIDALVKLMYGRSSRVFPRINRVEYDPEGYVLVSTGGDAGDSGKGPAGSSKLPEQGTLLDVCGVTPLECSNIFIIRNSDLAINSQRDFFTLLSEKLTGLRTGELGRVQDALLQQAQLTGTFIFRDIKGSKLKSRLDLAGGLVERIGAMLENPDQIENEKVAEEAVELEEKIDQWEREVRELEAARKRESYTSGKQTLKRIGELRNSLPELQCYNADELETWRRAKHEIGEAERSGALVRERVEKQEKQLEAVRETLRRLAAGQRAMEERKRVVDQEVRPLLTLCEQSRKELAGGGRRNRFSLLVLILCGILGAVALGGFALTGRVSLLLIFSLFLVGTFVAGWRRLWFLRKAGSLAEKTAIISGILARYGVSVKRPEDALNVVRLMDEEYAELRDRISDLVSERSRAEGTLKQLDEQLEEIAGRKERARETAESTAKDSGVESPGEYAGLLKKRQDLEREMETLVQTMERELGTGGTSGPTPENISKWTEKVNGLSGYHDKAVHVTFDQDRVDELQDLLREARRKRDRLEQLMRELRGVFDTIEQEAGAALGLETEDRLRCAGWADIRELYKRLQGFIEHHEKLREDTRMVVEIFELLEREERERMAGIFGDASAVSSCYERVTGGRYREVRLGGTGEIQVASRSGDLLNASSLSAGAFDQLYLTVRIALARQVLKGSPGFFIFDDPFIRSDYGRLREQFDTILEISRQGWQVLFFSAKREIEELARQAAQQEGELVRVLRLSEITANPDRKT